MALSEEPRDDIKRIFDIADRDKDGFVTRDELYQVQGIDMPIALVMMLEDAINADKDERLSFDEFINKLQQQYRS